MLELDEQQFLGEATCVLSQVTWRMLNFMLTQLWQWKRIHCTTNEVWSLWSTM